MLAEAVLLCWMLMKLKAARLSKSSLKPIPEGEALVGIFKGQDPVDMVREASASLGFHQVVKPGEVVLIKPNFGGSARGAYTSRAMVEAVATVAKEDLGADEVVIADGTASGGPTWRIFMKHELEKLAVKYRPTLRLVDFNHDEAVKVEVPNPYILRDLWVPRTILDVADVVISVPVLKTWPSTAVSLSLKNMFGVPPTRYYSWTGSHPSSASKSGLHLEDPNNPSEWLFGQSIKLSQVVADICTVVRSNISIIDSLTVCDETGVYDLNVVIAGFDPVAVDAVGCLAMGFNPKRILHLNMAEEKGLGTNDVKRIKLMGRPLEEVRRQCKPRRGMDEILSFDNPSS